MIFAALFFGKETRLKWIPTAVVKDNSPAVNLNGVALMDRAITFHHPEDRNGLWLRVSN